MENIDKTTATSVRQRTRMLSSDTKDTGRKQIASATVERMSPTKDVAPRSRTTEAKSCLMKIRLQINNSRNLKTEIKNDVIEATDRLFQLVKEAENERITIAADINEGKKQIDMKGKHRTEEEGKQKSIEAAELINKLDEHSLLLKQNKEEIEKLNNEIKEQTEEWKKRGSYAEVLVGQTRKGPVDEIQEMHSVIITSTDEQETGDQIYENVRRTINAKNEGLRIDRMRKGKDRKVIIGCRSKKELGRVKEQIKKAEGRLNYEDIKNKEPLIIMKNVLGCHTDGDILEALSTQNKHLLGNMSTDIKDIKIKYRRKTRNPHTCHVVMQVPSKVWGCLTAAGVVHIDVQRIRVEDQSPLVQCTRCLGYGHGRKFCREELDSCSHCGGSHLKADCPDWMAAEPPTCCNCQKAKLTDLKHNAFAYECPVRQKWDALARSAVSYC